VEFDAMNYAVAKSIYGRWVDGRALDCKTCKFFDHCSSRVRLGVFVACEIATPRDIELIEISPRRGEIVRLLEDGMKI
jgi:hypothetical protein